MEKFSQDMLTEKVGRRKLARAGTQAEGDDDLTPEQRQLEQHISKLVNEFDLTGDNFIGPNEFFNIIMAYFDK